MKILLVDDHALFRDGLSYVLDELEDDVSIIQASNHEAAFKALSESSDIDLILLDLNLVGETGFSILEICSDQYPIIPLVVISASKEHRDIMRAIDMGAMGYIPKDSTSKVMISALRMVLSGAVYVPKTMAKINMPHSGDSIETLFTPRQLEVLSKLVEGQSNKVIAARMDIAEATIKMHITAILKKLQVTNRTQAVLAAKKLNLSFL